MRAVTATAVIVASVIHCWTDSSKSFHFAGHAVPQHAAAEHVAGPSPAYGDRIPDTGQLICEWKQHTSPGKLQLTVIKTSDAPHTAKPGLHTPPHTTSRRDFLVCGIVLAGEAEKHRVEIVLGSSLLYLPRLSKYAATHAVAPQRWGGPAHEEIVHSRVRRRPGDNAERMEQRLELRGQQQHRSMMRGCCMPRVWRPRYTKEPADSTTSLVQA